MALSTDFRLIDTKGKIGLPETQLGIIPGFGGTVRMPRVIGVDNAIGNITTGKQLKAAEALKQHLVDAVVPVDKLVDAGHKMLESSHRRQTELAKSSCTKDWQNQSAICRSDVGI